MNAKRRDVLDRIESYEQAIAKARKYLELGRHADWSGVKPLVVHKFKDGKELLPHRDWVRNVFLPNNEKALRSTDKTLERLESHVV